MKIPLKHTVNLSCMVLTLREQIDEANAQGLYALADQLTYAMNSVNYAAEMCETINRSVEE